MAVRRERVVLTLEDHFTTEMARAAAATALLDKNLRDLDGSAVRVRQPVREVGRESDGLTRSVDRSASSINQLTGRLRIMADAAAILGPSLVPISAVAVPAVTGLASQLGFAAFGMTSLMAASQGVGDALKAVNEAAIEPTAANLEKAQQAMEQLGPDAQAFVARFQDLRPVLRDIRDAAAEGWFPGLTDSLDSLERVAPRVASIFEAIGRAGGNLVSEGAAKLAGPEWAEFLSFVENNAPQALDDLGRTIGNVARGLAELWMAFDPLNDSFSSWLLDASRGFAEWADGLAATEGFQEFVDYIRENGPRVADALTSIGAAVVEIVKAVAPLGGPSLAIIEALADAVATMAGSDLATPILAGVAALTLYNRTLQASAALQGRLGATTAAGGVTGPGFMARGGLAGLAKSAAPATLAMGSLALATADTNEQLIGTNASMGTFLGLLGGPLGAGIGLAAGNLLDLRSELQEIDKLISEGDQRSASAALQARMDAATNPFGLLTGRAQTIAAQDIFTKLTQGESASSQLSRTAGAFGDLDSFADLGIDTFAEANRYLAENEAAARRAEGATLGLSSASSDLAAANALSNQEMARSILLTNQRTDAALGAFGAETQWRQALAAATEQAKENNAGIRGNSAEALANRGALESLAAAWRNQRDSMEDAGRSADSIEKKYQVARRAFIDTATSMGVPIDRARQLARNLLAIPESVTADVKVNTAKAEAELRYLTRSRNMYINVISRRAPGDASLGGGRDTRGGSTAQADGGTVLGQRQPYGDKVLTMLAPGEEVISNRRGQADRWRPLLKAINGNRLADGGTVSPARPAYVPPSSGAITVATDPAILARLAAIESAVNRSSAVTRDEHATDRASQRSGASVAAMSKPRGYYPR